VPTLLLCWDASPICSSDNDEATTKAPTGRNAAAQGRRVNPVAWRAAELV